jgi:hypothetical protein
MCTAYDHRVNGGATAATVAVSTTLGRRGMLARKVRRRATRKGRVAGNCSRRTARVRVATRGRDVVRLYIREEGSLGWRGISEMGVWWRLWEGVYGLTVARWFALRIATALSDIGVGSSNYISNVDRLRVHASVYERHALEPMRACQGSERASYAES